MGDSVIEKDLLLQTQLLAPGKSTNLVVKVGLPAGRPWTRIFLQFTSKLAVSNLRLDMVSHDRMWSPSLVPAAELLDRGGWGHASDNTVLWDAPKSILLADVPAKGVWKTYRPSVVEDSGQEPLSLMWVMSVKLGADAAMGRKERIVLSILQDESDAVVTAKLDEVTAAHVEDSSIGFDFLVSPISIVTHQGEIWLHGKFTKLSPEAEKHHPFAFSYGKYEGLFELLPVENVRHITGDRTFSIRLPDTQFPGNQGDSLPTTYGNVWLKIAYKGDNGVEKPCVVGGVSITIDNREAVLEVPHLDMRKFDQHQYLVAAGMVRGLKGNAKNGGIARVGVSWVGADEESAIQWIDADALVRKGSDHWAYEIRTPIEQVQGVLRPTLHSKTIAGRSSSRSFVFDNASPLFSVALWIDASEKGRHLIELVPVDAGGVTSRGTYSMKPGTSCLLTCEISSRVGVHRVNVAAKLSGALVKQPGKALKVTPTDVSSARYSDVWDGHIATQVLSLADVRANSRYSLTFPLHIAEGAHGKPHFSIVLTDPEDVRAAGKQAFQAPTSYIAVLNIN